MRGGKRQRVSRNASHGRPVQKPRLASPANVSKRGLSARPYASHQTPIVVNTRLPKEILTGPSRQDGRLADQWTPQGRKSKPPACFRKRAALSPSGTLGHYAFRLIPKPQA